MKLSEKDIVVPGFLANGIEAGIKEAGKKDLALIFSEGPAVAAGVFTKNAVKAAPVLLDMKRIRRGRAQALIVNSGNANAATGKQGYADALETSRALSARLGIRDELVLVASTGVIGRRLPVGKITGAVDALVEGLRPSGIVSAEEAIMTTDSYPKIEVRKIGLDGREVTLCGMAKGAGMIEPDMATMLSFVLTDADLRPDVAGNMLRRAAAVSFNAISVDGCMSTNDTVILMANGRAGNRSLTASAKERGPFEAALTDVMSSLARAIVRDGEGATKVVEIAVEGARTRSEARRIAYGIGNSNLVKTAFYGKDPNWGRILSALGATGIPVPVSKVELRFEDLVLFRGGAGVDVDAPKLSAVMGRDSICVTVRLGMGKQAFSALFSDLTHKYVTINAHYTT